MTTAEARGLRALAAAALLAAAAAPGCTDWAGYDLDMAAGKVPQLATMRRSPIPDPYAMPRLPAEGSVPAVHPLGDVPAPYTQLQLDSLGAALPNPLPASPEVLARGELQYARNCLACHGPQGAGNGPVVGPGKFPFAPAINGAATAARADGYLYGVIDVGRGLMPPYGPRLTHADRWAVVHHLRRLQAAAPPPAAAASAAVIIPPPPPPPPIRPPPPPDTQTTAPDTGAGTPPR
ncbi:MAG TPA: cytochrome c [Longimicrobiaceae bacterium]|nr:cytochrome c [Longimicrobiaceae bacterium]